MADGIEEQADTGLAVNLLIALSMLAFAVNSLLCRFALRSDLIDPASFTMIRLLAGTAVFFLLRSRNPASRRLSSEVSWLGAVALMTYAWTFAFAYVALGAGTGALLLFGAVQATMLVGAGLQGERLTHRQILGLLSSLVGLAIMLVPQFQLPSLAQGALMISAGVAWGIYSLIGRRSGDAMNAIRLSFSRAAVLSIPLAMCFIGRIHANPSGIIVALLSGAVASGLGYMCWYKVLPRLSATTASIVQLAVPVLAAGFGAVIFKETLGGRYLLATLSIVVGVLLATAHTTRSR